MRIFLIRGLLALFLTFPALSGAQGFLNWQTHGGSAAFSGTLSSGSFKAPDAGCYRWTTDSFICRYGPGQVSITKDGTGATTNAGWILGYNAGIGSGSVALYNSTVTPANYNHTLRSDASNSLAELNAATGGTVYLSVNSGAQFSLSASQISATIPFTGTRASFAAGSVSSAALPPLSVTQTNSNAAVDTGVKFAFTDTTSAAGFLPFQVLGGAAGTTNLFSLSKIGAVTTGSTITSGGDLKTSNGGAGVLYTDYIYKQNAATAIRFEVDGVAKIGDGTNFFYLSPSAGNVMNVGTGAAGSTAGTIAATDYRVAAVPFVRGTAPTLASGGCTSPTAVTSNGTAAFSIGVGTGCSGSQPLVFTLPAATTGWVCTARNSSNGATSAPAQTGAVSTTSVTITSFSRTTGLAQAWTDSDNVVVKCMGY